MGGKAEDNASSVVLVGVFDVAPAGVAVTSGPDHRLVYVNDAYRAIFGERTLGVPFREAFGDLLQRGYFYQLDRVYTTGESLSLREMPFQLGDGVRERYASISISKVPLSDGVQGILMVVAEVTSNVDSARMIDESIAVSRHRFLQRYQSLLQIETDVVWVMDPAGQAIEPSPGWQRMTGQSWDEFRNDGWLQAVHPDDRDGIRRLWDTVRRTRDYFDSAYRLRMADGTYRHVRTRGAPVIDCGELIEWVGTCSDVEQEWQQERRTRLLDQAAAATANMADLDEVLTMLTSVIVPKVVDGCGIYLVPDYEGRPPSPLVVERIVSIVREDLPRAPEPGTVVLDGRGCAFAQAVRTRRPVRRVFPAGDPPPGMAPPGAEEWFAASGANSVAMVPVIVDDSVAAVLEAVICGDREPIGQADVELLNQLIEHAHAHLSNAMRFQRTQRVALALQHSLLPDPPQVPGLEITVRYRPGTTAAEIGGDWYDCFLLPGGAAILTIGDVAGHELAAAVTMSQIRNMLRGLAMDRDEPPGDILRRLNVATESLSGEVTATCVLARLESSAHGDWRLTYSVAGHPPPLLVTREGAARYLEGAVEPPLGIASDQPRASAVASLPPDSTLLLYTDGLIKHPGEHLDHGLTRLLGNVAPLAREPLDVLCDQLLAQMNTTRKDDIAMIALRQPDSLMRPAT
ncbi:SpoIIE family protein phosphatase [Nonomuraea jiangxiensis]|uniref:protein-serine/threonine phosphatase n=1 Tax=Nonomuraea jiangxiensis TaxID=633440 RepID=A0A1G8JA81_9ACTN|nr:SpoIIE family protein phosphatase [Nonomuraea jiangxiensis]SDI28178.1 PAS domain S-box-containing protein [Nonomuraea jiangxiensis]